MQVGTATINAISTSTGPGKASPMLEKTPSTLMVTMAPIMVTSPWAKLIRPMMP